MKHKVLLLFLCTLIVLTGLGQNAVLPVAAQTDHQEVQWENGFDDYGRGYEPASTRRTPSVPQGECRLMAVLPAQVDLSKDKYFPPIVSQGGFGACTSFAITYYQFTYTAARLNNWDAKADPHYRFSPKWTYNYLNRGSYKNGTNELDTFSILKSHGAARWDEFPYSSQKTPESNFLEWCGDLSVCKNALKTRASQFVDLFFADTSIPTPITRYNDPDLDEMKSLLARGKVLSFASWVGPLLQGEDFPCGKIVKYMETDNTGAHMMCIVGYDDTVTCDLNGNGKIESFEQGALKIANSWGTSFGNDGFVWVMYDALNTVSNAPNLNTSSRTEFLSSYIFNYMDVENYNPSLTAEITLASTTRGNIEMQFGEWRNLRAATPDTSISTCLMGQGEAYAFDGTKINKDYTFVLDLNAAADWRTTRQYVKVTNTNAGMSPTTIKDFRILEKGIPIYEITPNEVLSGQKAVYYTPTIPVTGIKVGASSLTLTSGQTKKLAATIVPTNASIRAYTWVSSNPAVATVAKDGTVTAKVMGNAVIKAVATDGGFIASCAVSVQPIMQSLTILNTQSDVAINTYFNLKASVAPADPYNGKVIWTSSNPDVLYIDDTIGAVSRPINPGTATITATAGGISKKFTITVHNYVTLKINAATAIQNGRIVTVDNAGTKPFKLSGKTMLPLRFVAEKMGGKVNYINDSKPITMTYGTKKVEFTLGSKNMTIYTNGKKTSTITLDVAAQKKKGKTYIPLRAIGQALGFDVYYQSGTEYIVVNNPKMSTDVRNARLSEAKKIFK